MKYLAIDYGTKRIGVALSYGHLAEPLTIIENTSDVHQKIIDVCDENQVTDIVFGISEGDMAQMTRDFAAVVAEKTQLPIHFFDETMSSKEVESILRGSGKGMKQRSQPIDHYAAAHVLQQFLDAHLRSESSSEVVEG